MNFILFVQDPTLVWNPNEPRIVELVKNEIAELVSGWTMGRVTIGLDSEGGRIEELEGIISGNIDQWTEAKEEVSELLANWEHGDIAGPVHRLQLCFDLNDDGSEG